jgi:hypothetical protein
VVSTWRRIVRLRHEVGADRFWHRRCTWSPLAHPLHGPLLGACIPPVGRPAHPCAAVQRVGGGHRRCGERRCPWRVTFRLKLSGPPARRSCTFARGSGRSTRRRCRGRCDGCAAAVRGTFVCSAPALATGNVVLLQPPSAATGAGYSSLLASWGTASHVPQPGTGL